MKLSDTESKLKNLNKKHEKLTDDDLKELMGIHRQTYVRGKGGAVRRK